MTPETLPEAPYTDRERALLARAESWRWRYAHADALARAWFYGAMALGVMLATALCAVVALAEKG